MSGAPLPPVIPEPFGKNADPSFIQSPIPPTTGTPGRASYDLGFPPLTMQPVAAGGVPPYGQDVNGVLNAMSAQEFYFQAGQLWPYNAAVATAIGGYALGARVVSADGKSIWENVQAGNTTDPDNDSTGASWAPLYSAPGIPPVGGGPVTGGTVTVPPSIARYRILSINGTLTSNLAVVLPSGATWIGVQWLVINNTGGAFTTTVRTAAGTGVAIPQGGLSNPVTVYGDGTNIYPTVPASSLIPADQAATPLTLVERTNTGNILGAFFNTTAPEESAGGISNVFCEGAGSDKDGNIRKFTLAYFEAQMLLSGIAGQVTAGQVPLAAVIQYVANILASAALTGTPTTPTAAANTRTTQVASTAFANPAANLTMPGSFKLASGHIVNYGTANPAGSSVTVPLDTPYSSATSWVVVAINISSGATQAWIDPAGKTNAQFVLHNSGGSSFYIAVGF